MKKATAKSKRDTRIGKLVPQFKVIVAVLSSVDTWRDYGQAEHSCEAKKRKPTDRNVLELADM